MRSPLIALSAMVLLAACDTTAPSTPQPPSKDQAAAEPTSGPASKPGDGAASKPADGAASAPAAPAKLEGIGVEKRYNFKVILKPEKPPLNSLFEAETVVTDAKTGAPVTGLDVSLEATMPEHKHGMMTHPTHKEVGEGRYATQGMKLHMPGSWELHAKATAPDGGDDHFKVRYNQPAKAVE